MIQNKSILAIIPARKGSKRLINKNEKILKGKPLIEWTINTAKKSKYIDQIIVSTDSKKIIQLSNTLNVMAPFIRPDYLSNDNSKSSDVIIHSINWLKKNANKQYDYFIFLQPTSPLRTFISIDNSIETFYSNSKFDYLISVSKFDKINKIKFSLTDKGFEFNESLKDYSNFFINGAIYIAKTNFFLSQKFF